MATTYWNGGNGDDLLDGSGSTGPLQIQGRAGDDTLTGGVFADRLYGDEGNDVLSGGAGADTLRGGAGADTFVIARADLGTGKVAILDFDGAGDGGGSGDVLRFTGFSTAATFAFVRQSGDDFVYRISDGALSREIAIKHDPSIRLVAGDYMFTGATPANRAPALTGTRTPLAGGTEDTAYAVTALKLLEGFTDADGDSLSISGLSADRGVVVSLGGGAWTLTPQKDYAGPVTLSYSVVDGKGGSVVTSRTLDLAAVNDAPVAGGDTATVSAAGPRTITLSAAALLANDGDVDGGILRITGVGTAAHGTLTFSTNGTPTNFADDTITYTAATGYAGADSFTYTLSDGTLSATGTVAVTVTAPVVMTYRNGGSGNDLLDGSGPAGAQQIQGRAGDDTVTGGDGNDKLNGNEGNDVLAGGGGVDTFTGGTGADIFVIAKTDLSGRESITDFEGAGDGGRPGGDVIHLSGFGAGATLTFLRQSGKDHIYEVRDGAFVAQLNVAYSGTALLIAGDYLFTTASAPANHAPIAGSLSIATATNGIVSGVLPASDADGDGVRFSLVSGPSHGTLSLGEDGAYIYAPAVGYSGGDAFRMRLDDGHGGVAEAIVSVAVSPSAADPAPWRDTQAAGERIFIQRDGTSGSFYVAAEMARVTKDGAVVAGWTSGGVIMGVPQGDGYVLETVSGGVTTTRPLAVGEVIVAAGQSNMEGWFTYPGQSHAAQPGIYQWSPARDGKPGKWIDANGAGALAFAETLRLADPGLPIAYVTGAVGGTKLLPATNVDYWLATGAGTLYQDTIDQVKEATHGQSALLLWNQGEADSASRVDPARYADGLRELFARFDGDIALERIVISGLAFTRGNADALRAAQASVATPDGHILYVPTRPAIETMDETHLTVPARVLQGTETALAVLAAEGAAPPGISRQLGGAANDTLIGGVLTDILQGGAGNDFLTGQDGGDILRGEAGSDRINGDGGNDALSGGLDNDTVDGGAGNDDVFGDGGNDLLSGGAGNDLLDGGTGADTLAGQAGNDLYVVDDAGDLVIEMAGDGVDTVYAWRAYSLAAFVENLIIESKDAIGGTGNDLNNVLTGGDGANLLSGLGGDDSLLGGAGSDTLDGGGGNDSMQGGSGADIMIGGAGNDTFYVEAGDTVIEALTGGTDTVITSITFTLPDNVEAVILGGKSAIGATGSNGANSLTGNGTANVLDGAGGNDTLAGLSGNDALRGGQGDDLLQGGEGADTLIGGVGVDILTGDAGKRSGDSFVFESLADLGFGATRDVVTDFDGQDVFDFRLIDANAGVAGDQAFTFVGSGAFTGAGQVRYTVVGGDIIISLNVNGDLNGDAEILLLHPLAAPDEGDFVL
ncbi:MULTISPECIES: cadherin-like domain-containing protein [Asticcacaulis]|uniref:cadherin-like domain-containing protein n=1 Tax=Asticcacaulis TaxID=76890 RepID=UPI001AE28BFD|nr:MULTISPECIES: cadherin-like domain-containing protein [Asticcacaulis]MBP2160390.1 Ca2+-binding RTX toxin-like protein [Asticcacaulis solisilvae]MDR6801307.1 Ca2+-binding RTX toxin-like protein [Asticcacaulis sp. BE141]